MPRHTGNIYACTHSLACILLWLVALAEMVSLFTGCTSTAPSVSSSNTFASTTAQVHTSLSHFFTLGFVVLILGSVAFGYGLLAGDTVLERPGILTAAAGALTCGAAFVGLLALNPWVLGTAGVLLVGGIGYEVYTNYFRASPAPTPKPA